MSHKNVFVKGPISAQFVGESIAKHQSKTSIGAHNIFLGQVRADQINGQLVKAIEYSAHIEMANQIFHQIREDAFGKFELTCMHIYHSEGIVNAGELCLFVFVSSPHRAAVFESINYVVERIKAEVPIFGREILDDDSHVWKINK